MLCECLLELHLKSSFLKLQTVGPSPTAYDLYYRHRDRDTIMLVTDSLHGCEAAISGVSTARLPMTREMIINTLRGQTISICNLYDVLEGWPRATNCHLERMREDISNWLDREVSQCRMYSSLKKSDLGLFGATWWPQAPFDRLRICTYFATWLFVWDDEIDSAEGLLWGDFAGAQRFRDETRQYVHQCLELSNSTAEKRFKPSFAVISSFRIIGEAICAAYNLEQRERVFKEIDIFMEMSEQEQRLRLAGSIPSPEQFSKYRLGSSAVAVCLTFNEFAWTKMQLPATIMEDFRMKLLWDQTNIIVATVNDLLSLKKEIARGGVESMVPILYSSSGDAQGAVEETTRSLKATVNSFEMTARQLGNDDAADADTRAFILGCRYYCTGNLTWSLSTGRYGIHQDETWHGIEITL